MELNSLADALSGLQANQSFMDVVGNNISNVNTIAYKTQSIRFEDLMNATLGYGQAKAGQVEGTNPFQIGMGVNTGTMNIINAQGSVQDTGRLTDMAIQGSGYFIVNNGQGNMYTRDGSFTVAPDGTLESAATGMTVQGWMTPKSDGTIDTTQPLTKIQIPVGSQTATATTSIGLSGNLNSADPTYNQGPPVVGQFQTTLNVYDSQGNQHVLNLTLQKQSGANSWNYTIANTGSDTRVTSNQQGTLTFNASGNLTSPTTQPTVDLTFSNGTAPGKVTVDFSKISQLAQTSQVSVATSDGTPGGTVSNFSVGPNGSITAVYSNGTSKAIGQIALADFRNPDGLIRQGNNLNIPSVNSGNPLVSVAGSGNVGSVQTGQLEGSNVDLAAQFGQMIQAQQGFNANTKVITTTNNLLQSVISIIP